MQGTKMLLSHAPITCHSLMPRPPITCDISFRATEEKRRRERGERKRERGRNGASGMGNTKAATTTRKTKKKGRPSLLDLQRRSLRLQQQRQQPCDPGSDDDPRLRDSAAAVADDDEESDHGRREKKLRLVLRLHNNPNAVDSAVSASESDDRRSSKLGASGNGAQTERQNPTSKVTDLPQDFGPTTPFPDKKLLVFILDRLQKKDTYGVFAEPVDPEELSDYHDIIKHPMDFATIRKKLSDGAYTNLEQFEKDVFLISSNAMQYNASDTIYYRQARAIQELAKKNFDSLRQESDDNDEEPKPPARRGRPPTKNIFKKLGRPAVDNVCSNVSSNATLANAGDNHQSTNSSNNLFHTGLDKTKLTNLPTKPYALRNTEPHSFTDEHKLERHEDNSGSAYKSGSLKYLKKSFVMDENRRSTYTLPEVVNSLMAPSVLTAFDGERKQLIPVGLYTEHAYARSLARFAAKLGPIAWEIAAKRIERVLPPGTKFGRGWIGEKEAPQQSHPLPSKSLNSCQPENLPTTSASASEHASDDAAIEVNTGSSSPAIPLSHPRRSTDSAEASARNQASPLKPHNAVGLHGMWQKTGNQLPQVVGLGFNRLSQVGNTVKVSASPGSFSSEAMVLHSRTSSDMLSRTNIQASSTSNLNTDTVYSVADPSTSSSVSGSHLPDGSHDSQGTRRVALMPKSVFISPDLNLGFQSTGSPVSGVRLDSKNPNLALGL